MAAESSEEEALGRWWRRLRPDSTGVVVEGRGSPTTAGGSNETLFFDVRWTEGRETLQESIVARLPPATDPLFPEYDLTLQFGCMREVARASNVPVPEILGTDDVGDYFGRPSYLMKHIAGRVPPDYPPYAQEGWLFDLEPHSQAEVYRGAIDMLAAIHAIDASGANFEMLDRGEYGPRGLPQQLAHQRAFLDWANRGEPHSVLDPIYDWLAGDIPDEDGPIGLDWGDAKLANLLYRGVKPVGVLDWEMAALGPPEVDLAYFIVMDSYLTDGLGHPRLPGAPGRDSMLAWYEARSGHAISPRFEWYEVFAGFRLGVILIRTLERLVAQGVYPADLDLVEANRPAAMAAAIIAGASRRTPGIRTPRASRS